MIKLFNRIQRVVNKTTILIKTNNILKIINLLLNVIPTYLYVKL